MKQVIRTQVTTEVVPVTYGLPVHNNLTATQHCVYVMHMFFVSFRHQMKLYIRAVSCGVVESVKRMSSSCVYQTTTVSSWPPQAVCIS